MPTASLSCSRDIANRRFGRSGPLEQLLLLTTDGLDSGGFLEHLKLPHYVDFQAELGLVRRLNAEFAARRAAGETGHQAAASPAQTPADERAAADSAPVRMEETV